jgi:uncharacterized membrane protein HdeD (DUF308 family)
MSNASTWKAALIAGVAIAGGCALVIVDWTLPQLGAFLGMFLVARGALHLVTTSFEGMPGALSALLGLGELAAGVLLLVWPSPTALVIVVVVGVWIVTRAVTLGATILATNEDHRRPPLLVVLPALELAGGIALFARASGRVRDVAVVIGVLMILDGITELLFALEAKRRRRTAVDALVAPQ